MGLPQHGIDLCALQQRRSSDGGVKGAACSEEKGGDTDMVNLRSDGIQITSPVSVY